MTTLLKMSNISKEFTGVKALDNVELDVRAGEVHALMGENGAGKSTLMKILIGIYTADKGEIVFNGHQLKTKSIKETLEAGISMIHQELNLVPDLSVAQNIYLGREPVKGSLRLVDKKKLYQMTENLFQRLNIVGINPYDKMRNLTVAKMQLVEIAKAVSYDSKLIIMDEPTSAISDKEVEQLFAIIEQLKNQHVGIIYISHKMDEINRIADRVTVFRDGQYIGTRDVEHVSREEIISMMVGRELNQIFNKPEIQIKEELALEVNGLCSDKFQDVHFKVRKGEIFGIAGLMGAGRSEVLETIFGIRAIKKGEIRVNNRPVSIKQPKDAIDAGLGLLTEDRKLTGCLMPLSVRSNMAIVNIDKYRKLGLLNKKKINEDAEIQKELLNIRTPNMDQLIKNLSGGNQQKVLLARWLLRDPDILFLDEPTRGIDIGAKAEIYSIIFGLAQQGKTIVVVSSEMPEIIGLCDRIMVMSEGKQTAILEKEEITQEKIMHYATTSEVVAKKVEVTI